MYACKKQLFYDFSKYLGTTRIFKVARTFLSSSANYYFLQNVMHIQASVPDFEFINM